MALAARTKPQQLGLSFEHWTLARLTEYVNHTLGIPISDGHLYIVLKQAGIQGFREKSVTTESPDRKHVTSGGRL
jgi:hypothetical protein